MRDRVKGYVLVALFAGGAGGAFAAGFDETSLIAMLTAADHEIEEGYFTLGDGTTVVARPGSELHQWLAAHRGRRVRLTLEATIDRTNAEPAMRPGTGRENGDVSWRIIKP
jgi:hypothetical protein